MLFWKCSKLNADMKNAEKNSEKIFCFWVKCIWTVCFELPLLITEYFSSGVNVLTKSLKTFAVPESYFSDLITFIMMNQYGKGAGVKIELVFWPVYHVACRGFLSNGRFYTFIQPRLLRSVISEIQKLWGSSFLENVWNLMQIWKMEKKILKKCYVFEINASELFALNCLIQ